MTLQETLTAAVRDLSENGFDTMERVDYWLAQIRAAAQGEMRSEADIADLLNRTLTQVYTRQVERGGLFRTNPGVSRFTVEKLRPELRAELDRRIMASAQLIRMNRAAAMERTLQRFSGWATSIPAGGSDNVDKVKIKQDIRKSIRQLPYAELRVAIDQGHKFSAALSETVAFGSGAIAGIWHSHWREAGYDYRRDHKERDDLVYAVKGNWAIERGLMNKGAGYTDDITRPAEEPFCFPGDSRIPYAAGVAVAYRRWFNGELALLVTASGKTIRATPNHPILTPNGWVAAGALKEGDEVIEIADYVLDLAESDCDESEPAIADVFAACGRAGVAEVTSGEREQFHGDGSEGYVDIVRTAGHLTFGRYATPTKRGKNLSFSKSHLGRATLGALELLGHARAFVAARLMGSLNQGLSPFLALSRHPDPARLRPGSDIQPHGAEALGQGAPAHPESFRDCEEALPFPVQATKVIQVERRQWAGHVFNLQTGNAMYSVNGVIVHNCRCYYQWIYSLRDLPPAMRTAKGNAELERVRIQARQMTSG